MTLAASRTAVETKLAAISGVDVVYPYNFFENESDEGVAKLAESGRINFWVIESAKLPSVRLACREKENVYEHTLTGFLSANDDEETRAVAEELVDTVENAFFLDPRLSSAVDYSDEPKPEKVQDVMLNLSTGKFRCHMMRVVIVTKERVGASYSS